MRNAPVLSPGTPTPDAYWETLRSHLRGFSPDEQRVAVGLYRELSKGAAVDDLHLGRALDVARAAVLAQDRTRKESERGSANGARLSVR
jgi:hypothetical protein